VANVGSVVVVGGTSEIGKRLAAHYLGKGHPVIVTSRDRDRAEMTARSLGSGCRGLSVDLRQPQQIAASLDGVDDVQHLALVAVERDANTVREYNIKSALSLVTLKMIGYTETIHVLSSRMRERGSIVLFGGLAKDRPYPGSLTVTTVNGAVSSMVRTLAIELAPLRVNAIHPGIVGDSEFWRDKAAALELTRSRTPSRELITVDDVVGATVFLLENRGMNAFNLTLDGGWTAM